ncbi:MAG: DUF6427 family protein [Bacteroidales bacterium]|jgi:hypothetical protein|nr:DUF6427 family protein [Bacteroidales bacterium]
MISILKSNKPVVIFFIVLGSIALWIGNFIQPVVGSFTFDKQPVLFYRYIDQYLQYQSFGSLIVTLLLLITQAFLLVQFNRKYILINYRTYLPAFFYVLIAGSFVPLQRINPVLPGTLFMFIALNFIYDIYRRDYALNRLYMAGLFVSFASMFWPPFAVFFLVIWIALTILRPFVGREWIVSLLGFLTPFLFVFTYYYVFLDLDKLLVLKETILNHFTILRNIAPVYYSYYIFYGLLFLIIVLASFKVIADFHKKKIKNRKYFEINWWIFLIGVMVFIFFENAGYEMIYFLALPISFLYTEYFYSIRSRWYLNIMLLLMAGSLVFIQIIAHS